MTANRSFYRLFNILLAVTLLAMAAFTIQQAAGNARVAEAAAALSADPASGPALCRELAPHQSIIARYIKDMKLWVAYTEDGPAGVDGGLMGELALPRCK